MGPMNRGSFTKLDIIRELSEKYKKYGVTVANTRRVVDGVFELISKALSDGRKVEVRNFGIFKVVDRAARVARNPKTGERINVGARKGIKFISGREMSSRIQGNSQSQQQGGQAQ